MDAELTIPLYACFGILLLTTYVCYTFFKTDNRLNSNVNGQTDVSFRVEKIEEAETQYEEGHMSFNLWKYTAISSFFGKSKHRDFVYNTYVFYDQPHKYNIGDILTLTKIEKTCKKKELD